MDYTPIILTVLGAVLGSSGLFTLITFLINRHDGKDEKLASINNKIDSLRAWQTNHEKEADGITLAVTRLQLIWLIQTNPHNHDTILKTAERYFIELKGDSEAFDEFDKWRRREDVSISWFEAVIARELDRTGKC